MRGTRRRRRRRRRRQVGPGELNTEVQRHQDGLIARRGSYPRCATTTTKGKVKDICDSWRRH